MQINSTNTKSISKGKRLPSLWLTKTDIGFIPLHVLVLKWSKISRKIKLHTKLSSHFHSSNGQDYWVNLNSNKGIGRRCSKCMCMHSHGLGAKNANSKIADQQWIAVVTVKSNIKTPNIMESSINICENSVSMPQWYQQLNSLAPIIQRRTEADRIILMDQITTSTTPPTLAKSMANTPPTSPTPITATLHQLVAFRPQ